MVWRDKVTEITVIYDDIPTPPMPNICQRLIGRILYSIGLRRIEEVVLSRNGIAQIKENNIPIGFSFEAVRQGSRFRVEAKGISYYNPQGSVFASVYIQERGRIVLSVPNLELLACRSSNFLDQINVEKFGLGYRAPEKVNPMEPQAQAALAALHTGVINATRLIEGFYYEAPDLSYLIRKGVLDLRKVPVEVPNEFELIMNQGLGGTKITNKQ